MKVFYQHPIVTSFFLTAILLAIAAVSGGVGHGNYTPAIILFPYAAVAAVVLDHFISSTVPMIVLASLQFPLYGTLIRIGRGRVSTRSVFIAVLASHAIAVLVAVLVVYY
jgi:hypothetical protein